MTDTKEMVKVQDQGTWEEALEKEAWVAPLVNIYESDDNFIIDAYMPGVTRDNVKIKLEDGSLVLMGRINFEEAMNKKYILNELEVSNFYRKFNLSDSVDEGKIEAKLENGVLSITLPKHERVKPKTIEIN